MEQLPHLAAALPWARSPALGSLKPRQTEHSDTGRTEGSLFTPMSGMREWTPHLQKAQTPQAWAFPEIGLPLFQTTQGARFTKPPGDRLLGAWSAAAHFLATSTWPGALLCAERLPRQSSVKTKASAKTTEPSASGTTSTKRPLAFRAECQGLLGGRSVSTLGKSMILGAGACTVWSVVGELESRPQKTQFNKARPTWAKIQCGKQLSSWELL